MSGSMQTVSGEALGPSGRFDAATCSALALRLLGEAVAPLMLSSLTLEMTGLRLQPGASVDIRTRVDKRTHAVAFTTLEAHADGELAFTARALFTAEA